MVGKFIWIWIVDFDVGNVGFGGEGGGGGFVIGWWVWSGEEWDCYCEFVCNEKGEVNEIWRIVSLDIVLILWKSLYISWGWIRMVVRVVFKVIV